jgi:hypothetical protein
MKEKPKPFSYTNGQEQDPSPSTIARAQKKIGKERINEKCKKKS